MAASAYDLNDEFLSSGGGDSGHRADATASSAYDAAYDFVSDGDGEASSDPSHGFSWATAGATGPALGPRDGGAGSDGAAVAVVEAHGEATDPAAAKGARARNWHEEFQRLLERPVTTPADANEQARLMTKLQHAFAAACLPTVVTIVSELHLSSAEKTIRPFAAGGIAGGVKYVCNNVFFKLQVDTSGLYGGAQFAAKAAGHELKGAVAVLRARIPNLHVPLHAVIDFCGVRCLAQTLLPGDSGGRLAYGSEDGGITAECDDSLAELMTPLGASLNLRPHPVAGKTLAMAADVEGRIPSDARRFCVDLARVFPPTTDIRDGSCLARMIPADGAKAVTLVEFPLLPVDTSSGRVPPAIADAALRILGAPSTGTGVPGGMLRGTPNGELAFATGGVAPNVRAGAIFRCEVFGDVLWVRSGIGTRPYLWRLMRPEFVEQNARPLNPDGMLRLSGSDGSLADLRDATDRLLESLDWVAAAVAEDMEEAVELATTDSARLDVLGSIKGALHSQGINMRYIGRVRQLCPDEGVSAALAAEAMARVGRRLLENVAREYIRGDTDARNAALTAVLYGLVGIAPHDRELQIRLRETAALQFQRLLAEEEVNDSRPLWISMGIPTEWRVPVLQRACDLIGVKISCDAAGEGGSDRTFVVSIDGFVARQKDVGGIPSTRLQRSDNELYSAAVGVLKSELSFRQGTLGDDDHVALVSVLVNLGKVYGLRPSESGELASACFLRAVSTMRGALAAAPPGGAVEREAALQLASVAEDACHYLFNSAGEVERAWTLGEEAVDTLKAVLGDRDARVASALVVVARMASKTGDHTRARELFAAALEIHEALPEDSDERLLTERMYALHLLNEDKGARSDEAIALFRRAYEGSVRAFGARDARTADAANDLAQALSEVSGASEESERLMREALDIRRSELGDDHPLYAGTLNNVALLLQAQGRFAEAVVLIEESVRCREAGLGETHIDVAESLSTLGTVLEDMGEYGRAEPILRRCRDILVRRLGPSHKHAIWAMKNLGTCLKILSRNDEALDCFQAALAQCRSTLGEDSLDFGLLLCCIAEVKAAGDDKVDAESHWRRGLQAIRDAKSDLSREYASMEVNFANFLLRTGRGTDALPLLEHAVTVDRATHGDVHPATATAVLNLGSVYFQLGRLESAQACIREAVDTLQATVGEDHPTFRSARHNLEVLMHSMSAAPPPPPEVALAEQLSAMESMGFSDRDANLRALLESGGDVDAAITALLR